MSMSAEITSIDIVSNKLKVISRLWRERGVYFVLRRAAVRLIFPYWSYKLFAGRRKFQFQGRCLSYFYHSYNTAWRNERTVEIPVVLDMMNQNRDARVLEVGNVLQHYLPDVKHLVVDKYEKGRGVRNIDAIDIESDEGYDLIVSISTIEHVGWDEEPRDPEKAIRAISHLKSLLAPQGRLLVTVPLGYNEYLDRVLEEEKAGFDRITYLERSSQFGAWEERACDQVVNRVFDNPYAGAGAVAICEYQDVA